MEKYREMATKLVAAYDLQTKKRAELKTLDALIATAENILLGELQKGKGTSFAVELPEFDDAGNTSLIRRWNFAPMQTERFNVPAETAGLFFDWVIDNGASEFLQKAVAKEPVVAYREKTGELPPGVRLSVVHSLSVRSTKRPAKE